MWIRSSFCSKDSCVEAEWTECSTHSCVQAAWSRAADCSQSSCVEVIESPDCPFVHVRDSKDADGTQIVFRREDWDGGAVVHFQEVPRSVVPSYLRVIADLRGHDTGAQWYRVHGHAEDGSYVSLWFDQDEKDAWQAGVAGREFAVVG